MRHLPFILAVLCLLFGIATYDREAYKWGIFSTVLYALPLLSFATKNKLLRVYTVWFGIFLVSQTVLSYYKYQHYHHLTPNIHYQIDVQGDGLPGIQGIQTITTDAFGFRTTKNIEYQKKSPGYRIFALGASTTESIYIDDHKTWPHLLQEKLTKKLQMPVEVINASVSGLRMAHIYDNFKKVLKLQPDMVLFLIGVNDWNKDILNQFDSSVEVHNRFYKKFGLEYYQVTKLYLRNSLFGLALQSLPFKKATDTGENSSVTRIEKGEYFTKQNNTLTRQDVRKYVPEDILPEYRTYLEKTAALCDKSHVQCVFLTQPNAYKAEASEKTKKTFWMTPPNGNYTLDFASMIKVAEVYNLKLKEFAKAYSIPLCDLNSQIPPSEKSFYDEVHFNEPGSELVASKLEDCISELINTTH